MFDYHMHTKVSFDGRMTAKEAVEAAIKKGLKEICFTDHIDSDPLNPKNNLRYKVEDYNAAYNDLCHNDLIIRRGMEFGLLPDNMDMAREELAKRHYDFVIGSVHFVEGLDVYFDEYWQNKTVDEAERIDLEETLQCVKSHNDFDVLGHLTYITKTRGNPLKRPIPYEKYREITDEIFKILIQKGKGIEVNTSGMRDANVFLPTEDYLHRFKELGGEIVTVGSDAHDADRVGAYCKEACKLVQDIFGYVCTFRDRKPIFHKI